MSITCAHLESRRELCRLSIATITVPSASDPCHMWGCMRTTDPRLTNWLTPLHSDGWHRSSNTLQLNLKKTYSEVPSFEVLGRGGWVSPWVATSLEEQARDGQAGQVRGYERDSLVAQQFLLQRTYKTSQGLRNCLSGQRKAFLKETPYCKKGLYGKVFVQIVSIVCNVCIVSIICIVGIVCIVRIVCIVCIVCIVRIVLII